MKFKKIYTDSELEENSTIRKFRIVQIEDYGRVQREINHYNLQMIIAVCFKVNNEREVQFSKWANGIAKDYTIKGWDIDDERGKIFLNNNSNSIEISANMCYYLLYNLLMYGRYKGEYQNI